MFPGVGSVEAQLCFMKPEKATASKGRISKPIVQKVLSGLSCLPDQIPVSCDAAISAADGVGGLGRHPGSLGPVTTRPLAELRYAILRADMMSDGA